MCTSNTNNDNLYPVGNYKQDFNNILKINLPCETIYQSVVGLQIHIKKRHPHCIKYLDNIPDILASPDYIGHNPKESNSIELIKCYADNIKVAIKLDTKNNHLYVASLYDIKDSKLQRHLDSGRLKIFNSNIDKTK